MIWNPLADTKLIEQLGWTLLHSVWQIALAALILYALLRLMRSTSANVKYVVAVSFLAISVALPVVTFLQISERIDITKTGRQYQQQDDGFQSGEVREGRIPVSQNAIATQSEHVQATVDVSASLQALRNFLERELPAGFPFVVALWLIGVGLFSFRMVGGVWQLHQYKTSGRSLINTEWQKRFSALSEKLSVNRAVRFAQSNLIGTPIAFGVFKPLIIVPAGIFLQIDPRQLESIIAHELIHIRRYDPLVNIIQNVVEVLFFYHPCVWWISKQIRREREFAADAAVTSAIVGCDLIYATALANLEEIRLSANKAGASMATAANGGNLMQRIQKILHQKTEITRASSAWPAGLAIALISAVLLGLFSFTPATFVNAQKKANGRKLAIGFVSIPPLARPEGNVMDSDATTRLMIAKLAQYKIPAVGFVTGSMISDGDKFYPVRANMVRMWRDAGLEVGIGNFKHIWFYNTPYDDYVAGVEKNEAVVKKMLAEKNLPLKYFSYPYLNTGKSVEERDRFESWLNAQGLHSVKYTIDNQEWMYSYAYDMARSDNDVNTMTEVRVAFIKYMDKMFDHYEAYSQDMFGRDIPQTMVLTTSRLVADSADDLFGMIQKRGYNFVSMDEAQADEAYKTPENVIGNFGNSWFERWTATQGKKLREEPKVDDSVAASWKERQLKK
jgi:beta-lactamase regulating signal transducer with metallopeptidase domain/peptidoglycan/xylan/chitin deacetylase (PgdA/CDA1 family)